MSLTYPETPETITVLGRVMHRGPQNGDRVPYAVPGEPTNGITTVSGSVHLGTENWVLTAQVMREGLTVSNDDFGVAKEQLEARAHLRIEWLKELLAWDETYGQEDPEP